MPHPRQKNPKIKKLIINLDSMPLNKKANTYWPLRIKV
jgi:hypothetical protein